MNIKTRVDKISKYKTFAGVLTTEMVSVCIIMSTLMFHVVRKFVLEQFECARLCVYGDGGLILSIGALMCHRFNAVVFVQALYSLCRL